MCEVCAKMAGPQKGQMVRSPVIKHPISSEQRKWHKVHCGALGMAHLASAIHNMKGAQRGSGAGTSGTSLFYFVLFYFID
jgi:hypothetical protein